MTKIKIFFAIFWLMSNFPSEASTKTFDNTYIENFAKSEIEKLFVASKDKKISINVPQLDPRIHIKPCDHPLSANIPENHNSRNVNIKISCEGSIPWSIFLPIKIRTQVPVLVASSNIDKGSALTKSNLSLVYIDEVKIRGERITKIEDVLGAKTKRTVTVNKPITRRNICLVCKGDAITIVAKSSSFSIKTAGTSLGFGHLGDAVKIKNNRSGKLLTARVSGLNKVEIIL